MKTEKTSVGELKERSGFSGSLGFILAAAGSAVGLGNIWRFPYCAAEGGGGLFLLIYIILVVVFGYVLLSTDISIGRKTGMSSINAYGSMNRKWKFVGILAFIVPSIIITYYIVIGGWIFHYAASYITMSGDTIAQDGYFTSFISSGAAPIVFMLIYLAVNAVIVMLGVEKGIERFSKFIMISLIALIIFIAVYSVTITHTDESGVTRTGLDGLAVYFIPNFDGLTLSGFAEILMNAISQMFFSLSIAMGIMVTYGSYVKKEVNLSKSVKQICIFDSAVAILAGMIIVPAVFVFFGMDGMTAGTGLMFVTLPKVFQAMGGFGPVIAIMFFIMVAFAAITSSVSILEAIVANAMEVFHKTRKQVCLVVIAVAAAVAVIVCLGYNVLYAEIPLPAGGTGQILDVLDYMSNDILMPFIALFTCILIGWVLKPSWVTGEMEASGHKLGAKGLFSVMLRFVGPALMVILILNALGVFNKIG